MVPARIAVPLAARVPDSLPDWLPPRAPATPTLLLLLTLLLCLPRPASATADLVCQPWPGEIAPLPTVSDPDRVRARWAKLRAAELAKLAAPLETIATVDAQRLWRHVLCLDPGSADAKGGVERTLPSRVSRLVVLTGSAGPTFPAPDIRSALANVGRPLRLEGGGTASAPAAPPATPAALSAASFGPADHELTEAESLNRQARFEEALAAAEKARSTLPIGWTPDVQRRRARIEVAAATALVALGREREARTSFGEALQADPSFRLDARTTSPKVMRAFDAARSAALPAADVTP
jgi:tetratricopeptide (TPR) repeat protein